MHVVACEMKSEGKSMFLIECWMGDFKKNEMELLCMTRGRVFIYNVNLLCDSLLGDFLILSFNRSIIDVLHSN